MTSPTTFAIQTLGCKLNYSESSTLARQLRQRGWMEIQQGEPADLYILNTCSVTEFADKKCRRAIRRYKRNNPSSKVIVTGCYAQLKPEEIADMQGVDLVLGAAEKFQLLDYVDQIRLGLPAQSIARDSIDDHNEFHPAWSVGSRTRTFLKIQDGCNYKCSFCTIPQARGKSRSATIDHVLSDIRYLVDQGVQEIVLTGVNIGDFGLDPAAGKRRSTFLDLLREIDQSDASRIRISSIEPNLCSDEIIEFVAASSRFMPHFHMPLQSGSDEMLKRMRRRYRRDLYVSRVELIKKLMPHACIGADVIVGFHGETDTYFDQTRHLILDLDVSYLHVFTYSMRNNTHAESLNGKVPMNVRRQRNQVLRTLSMKKRHHFYRQHEGAVRPVLFESSRQLDNGKILQSGYTDNYIRTEVSSDDCMENEIHSIQLDHLTNEQEMSGILAARESDVHQ